jgi:hypothetical protein
MTQVFGSETPRPHHQTAHRQASRYLVIIEAGGSTVARLFLDDRTQAGEFDAGAEEVAWMVTGQAPTSGAQGPEWDRALEGHSAEERAAAAVYTLAL